MHSNLVSYTAEKKDGETKTSIVVVPSPSGAAAGAAVGMIAAGPAGAVVGAIIGGVFGPADEKSSAK